jgi:hypothetical protein
VHHIGGQTGFKPSSLQEARLFRPQWPYRFDVAYVSQPEDLARYYSAADVFLFCSLADNQPLAIIEAMSAGTPLVGFAIAASPKWSCRTKPGFWYHSGMTQHSLRHCDEASNRRAPHAGPATAAAMPSRITRTKGCWSAI